MTATDPNLQYWDDIFASRGWGRYPPEELVRFMARKFGKAPNKAALTILEVGCGPGPNLWFLSREGFSVAGIDGSAHAIKTAGERLAAEKLPLPGATADLKTGDFARLPWPDAAFDAVIDIEGIYSNNLATIRSTIAEIHRVLKPGGYFFGKMFGDRSTGADTGTLVEPGTRAKPTAGPCIGNNLAHFFAEAEFAPLFAAFGSLDLDWVQRSDGGRAFEIFEWLVTARK